MRHMIFRMLRPYIRPTIGWQRGAEATRAGEFQQELINNLQVGDEAGGTFGNIQGSSTPLSSTGTQREKMEQLLNYYTAPPFSV
jgi:hypothetical protein